MTTLHPVRFEPLNFDQIQPMGWLANQLRIQADGISGHLDEFWPDIQNSRWFGGDREGWERAPYWLDGLIPLAYLTKDAVLLGKVQKYLDYILTHQQRDGWLGPEVMVQSGGHSEDKNYDLWGQILATKVLVQYHTASGDQRALIALEKALLRMDRHIDTAPLFNWGQFRWFETLIAIIYLFEKSHEKWLLDLAVKVQAQGFDWRNFFLRWPLTEPTTPGRWNYAGHVVNNAMAIKSPSLWWRISGEAFDRQAASEMIAKLDQFHGMVTGVFSGDECLAGRSPVQGTELCAVVEFMYSLENLLSIFGDPVYADRLESIAFNALPATFSPDMWAHQYDQQVNQVECSILPGRTWNTNGPESNIFGVEPNYGCCTANLSQGWPKFAANMWMKDPAGGLAALVYAPCQVETVIKNVPVKVSLKTDYPFKPKLSFSVHVEGELQFPIFLRIPAWADKAVIHFEDLSEAYPAPGTYFAIDRNWKGQTNFEMVLPMQPQLVPGDRGAVAIRRGPLMYSLKIKETWQQVNQDKPYREKPHADWEVYPATPWNYALQVSETSLDVDLQFHEGEVGHRPFSPDGAPVAAEVFGRRLPQWMAVNGSAAPVPLGPLTSEEPLEKLTLIPYGCTNLRITEFPVLKKSV
jgi:hypothetical protein